jgi:hypothetical protein
LVSVTVPAYNAAATIDETMSDTSYRRVKVAGCDRAESAGCRGPAATMHRAII